MVKSRGEYWFDRLPMAAKESVSPAVWSLSQDSTDMMVQVHYRRNFDPSSMHVQEGSSRYGPHACQGVSGMDLYARGRKRFMEMVLFLKLTSKPWKLSW